VNNANEEGPFSTERAGSLPAGDLVRLCFSGKYTREQLIKRITSEGGMYAYLGTKDVREVLARIDAGDEKARLVFDAMIYQTGKETGAMAAALCGDVDAVVISGGASHSSRVVDALKAMTSYIAPVLVYPGGDEMAALAQGVLRVLRGEESPRQY
jgi:butyrate kinase